MRTLLAMAWRNVLRNRRRSVLTAGAMGVAVAFLMVVLALVEGMYGQMRDVVVTRNLGHVQVHHDDWPGRRQMYDALDDVQGLLGRLDAEPAVAASTARLFGNALIGGAERTEAAQLVGVEPAREDALRRVSEQIAEGAWLPEAPEGAIVLGADLAKRLEAGVGDALVAVTQAADGSLGNELYTVVGTVRTGSPSIDRAGAFVHRIDLGRLLVLPDRAHEVVAIGHADDTDTVLATQAAVAGAVGGDRLLVRAWWEVDPTTEQLFAMQALSSWILVGFFFGVSAVGVVNTLLMSVFERTRELGVMRALGMRPRAIVALVVLEAVVLACMAVAAGLVLGGLGDLYLVQQGLDLSVGGEGYNVGDMTFDPIVRGRVTPASVYQPVLGVFAFTLLAAVWPALRAARLRPVDALREV